MALLALFPESDDDLQRRVGLLIGGGRKMRTLARALGGRRGALTGGCSLGPDGLLVGRRCGARQLAPMDVIAWR